MTSSRPSTKTPTASPRRSGGEAAAPSSATALRRSPTRSRCRRCTTPRDGTVALADRRVEGVGVREADRARELGRAPASRELLHRKALAPQRLCRAPRGPPRSRPRGAHARTTGGSCSAPAARRRTSASPVTGPAVGIFEVKISTVSPECELRSRAGRAGRSPARRYSGGRPRCGSRRRSRPASAPAGSVMISPFGVKT